MVGRLLGPRLTLYQFGDAGDAFGQVGVTEGVGQPKVAGGAERLAGHDGDLGLVQDHAGQLEAPAASLACVGVLSGFEALLNPMPISASLK